MDELYKVFAIASDFIFSKLDQLQAYIDGGAVPLPPKMNVVSAVPE